MYHKTLFLLDTLPPNETSKFCNTMRQCSFTFRHKQHLFPHPAISKHCWQIMFLQRWPFLPMTQGRLVTWPKRQQKHFLKVRSKVDSDESEPLKFSHYKSESQAGWDDLWDGCERVCQKAYKLTLLENPLRADFLHPTWTGREPWAGAFSGNQRRIQEVAFSQIQKAHKAAERQRRPYLTCLLSTSIPWLPCRHVTILLWALWETRRTVSRRRSICKTRFRIQ